EKVKLKKRVSGLSSKYINGQQEYYKNGKPYKFDEVISLTSENPDYFWIYLLPASPEKYDIFPMTFEKDNWY
ncbi:hypothetical protein, partial [Fulvivirga aurantia]|uniref:hypothetical protein n=1 Tax=Fulvivirga aurantia TaxID=2529383 RepID=UPI001CA3E1EC